MMRYEIRGATRALSAEFGAPTQPNTDRQQAVTN
jgi:hypothetical protein